MHIWRSSLCYDQLATNWSAIIVLPPIIPVSMPLIFVHVLFTKHVMCLRVRGVAISQRQLLVAFHSTGFCMMPSDFCGLTTLICRLICRCQDSIVLRPTVCVVNFRTLGCQIMKMTCDTVRLAPQLCGPSLLIVNNWYTNSQIKKKTQINTSTVLININTQSQFQWLYQRKRLCMWAIMPENSGPMMSRWSTFMRVPCLRRVFIPIRTQKLIWEYPKNATEPHYKFRILVL